MDQEINKKYLISGFLLDFLKVPNSIIITIHLMRKIKLKKWRVFRSSEGPEKCFNNGKFNTPHCQQNKFFFCINVLKSQQGSVAPLECEF